MNTLTNRTIIIHDQIKPIELEYSDNGTYFGDTAIRIYDDYKISLVLTDDCGAVIGNKVFFPRRGDMIIFRPSEVHFGRFPKSSKYRFVTFLFPVDLFDHIYTTSKQIIAPFLDNSEDRINLIRLPEKHRNKLIDLVEELLLLMKDESNGQYFDVLAFSKLIEALNLCNQFYPQQKASGIAQPPHPIVNKALSNINTYFPAFIGLDQLAEHCGCSVTYLTQTFHSYTGKTIYGYLTELRLEQARQLLTKGVSVTEAAYRCGFYDTSRFILQFKKHFHITPGQFKKKLH